MKEKAAVTARFKNTRTASRYSHASSLADSHGLGASGSIFSILTILVCSVPRLPLAIWPLPFALPGWVVLSLSAGASAYCMVEEVLPFIGHAGHLGGMAFGVGAWFAYLRPWLRRIR